MSPRNVPAQNLATRTDMTPRRNNGLAKYMEYIVAAVPKVPYSRRLSRLVSTCRMLETYANSASCPDSVTHEMRMLLRNLCFHCRDWAKHDIVHVLVRVPHEMKRIEEIVEVLCHKEGLLPHSRSVEDIERYEKKDWTILMQKTKSVLSHKEFRDECLALENQEAEDMMKVMQKLLVQSAPDHPNRTHAFKILNSLSKRCKRFVTVKTVKLDGGEEYVAAGGCGSVSKAAHNGTQVAVKAITLYSQKDNSQAERMLRREILLWNLLTHQHHPHILPLIGVTDSQFPYIKMVAPWQENGKLSDYVQQPGATRVNRLKLLAQVCSALQYLHNHVPIVIHADLKCANVLVSQDGNPYLADFGLATIRHNGATMTSTLEGGSTRWMAPELFMNAETDTNDSEDDVSALKVTRHSDIWSFGMLVLELLTDELPFPDKSLDAAVICALIKGERPKHPRSLQVIRNGLNNELWQYLAKCWDSSPEHRLPLHSLYDILDQLAARWHPASPDVQDQTPQLIETISVPTSACGRIVGPYGVNIRQYESDLDVKIQLTDSKEGSLTKCEITGLPENVKEAQSIIEQLVETHTERVQETIDIPGHLHGYLIGSQGVRIREFQTKHQVTVSLDRALNQAVVRGPEKNVYQAIEELRQTVKLDKEWAPTLRLSVTKRAARRLLIEKNRITDATGLDLLTTQETGSVDGSPVVMIRGKTPRILDNAKRMIQRICGDVQGESELELKISPDLHGLILGTHWKTWNDLVLRCGGPHDPQLQKEIIEIDRTSDQVYLRGQSMVINALAKEIQTTIHRTKVDIYSMCISPRYHGELRWSISETQRKTKARILIPGDERYDKFNDPVDISKSADSKSIVKIVGTRDAYAQARDELETKLRDIQRTQRVLIIPSKHQQAILGQTQMKLRDMGVRASFSIAIKDESPIRPLHDGQDWHVIERYNSHITDACEWTLRGATEDALNQAQTLIEKASEKARQANYIGFLTFPDSSKFGRIVGRSGETIQKLQQETNTTIIVPKVVGDYVIEITGSSQDIEKAKMRIKDLVTKNPPSPTDRLFRPSSRMNSRNNSS